MVKESIARRYAAALFALATEAGTAEATVKQLDTFVGALDADPENGRFFASPVIDRALKEQMLVKALSGVDELLTNFVVLLVRKRRENLVRLVARQMHELLDESKGRETARIETPAPLDAHELAQLANRLSKVYGRTIVPQAAVEPDLLGGIVVQVGDKYVDASVAGRLEELRRHLLASADTSASISPNGHANPTATHPST